MRSNRKKTGLIIFLSFVVVLVGVGSAFLMDMDLSGNWSSQTINDNPVPLSDGSDEVYEPVFEPEPEPAPVHEEPAPAPTEHNEQNNVPTNHQDPGEGNQSDDENAEAMTGRKKKEPATDEIEFQQAGETEEPANVSQPAALTDVTETEAEADLEIEQEEADADSELPQEGSVRVTVNPDGPVEIGQTVKLSAHVRGFEKGTYELFWQVKDQTEEWTDIQGAHGKSLKLVINEDNITYQWRAVVVLNEA